ncbi:MAG: PorT family protein [Chitinophagaceae bacterium]|nr:PorT family protein [Chitinophagaceae bacterium]
MKKIILFAAFAVVGYTTQAQAKYGAKAGVNFADFNGSDADGFSSLTGFNLGGFANIPVTENFSLQPELLFSKEGGKFSGGKITTSYINIPVMLQYNISNGFYGETGPQIGILASAKSKIDGVSGTSNIKDEFKGSNFSWGLGFGYKMTNGLGFNGRYNLGLGTVIKDATVKTSNIAFGLSYTIGSASSKN